MRNKVAMTWRELAAAFSEDAASARVDALAADFTAQVGTAGCEPCLGLFEPRLLARYYGLVFLLDGYGLELRQKLRPAGDGVFLYARPKDAERRVAVSVAA